MTLLTIATACAPVTRIPGSELALCSGGGGVLQQSFASNGYVGTYVHRDSPGDVQILVEAAGTGTNRPQINVVLADATASFQLGPRFRTCKHGFHVPAGTHFVRAETTSIASNPDQRVSIRSLAVRGAEVRNAHTDANALAAADTYAANFRRGDVRVKLDGVAPGTPVRARLVRRAFNFGANSPGIVNRWMVENPPAGSDEAKSDGGACGGQRSQRREGRTTAPPAPGRPPPTRTNPAALPRRRRR